MLRGLVSKKKVRYQEDGYDLDLTYIDPDLIAMGFPSEGREAIYRNPMSKVQKLLNEKHGGHFKVYNLCCERQYNADKFGGNVAVFPMADHNVCEFVMIKRFCEDVHKFLKSDPKNVAAIHCKAGKGRTGFMMCCYLVWSGRCKTAEEALKKFGDARTSNGKGVTIPSQIRYVKYMEDLVKQHGTESKLELRQKEMELHHVRFHGVPNFDVGGGCDPYFKVSKYVDGKIEKFYYSHMHHKVQKYKKNKSKDALIDIPCHVKFSGDVKLTFYDADKMNKDDTMFWLWINTSLTPKNIQFQQMELDGAHKENKDCFEKGFKCELFFDDSQMPLMKSVSRLSMSETKSPTKKGSKKSFFRSLVSKKKIRFQQGKYDLDLTYITDNLIAMGYPSTGTESMYRNPLNMVQEFFQEMHPGRFRIYNLCSEKTYDPKIFGGTQSCAHFPFKDHNACRFTLIEEFCMDVDKFVNRLAGRVAAVHCKAGKGRTGMMISSYLLHSGFCSTANDALESFAHMRTHDGKGVTIPSQQRYVEYYQKYLQARTDGHKVNLVKPKTLQSIEFCPLPSFVKGKTVDPYFTIKNADHKEIYDSRKSALKKLGSFDCTFCVKSAELKGDCKFEFFDEASGEKMFWCWINIALASTKESFTKKELDGACKKNKKHFDDDFVCNFLFLPSVDVVASNRRKKSIKEKKEAALNTATL